MTYEWRHRLRRRDCLPPALPFGIEVGVVCGKRLKQLEIEAVDGVDCLVAEISSHFSPVMHFDLRSQCWRGQRKATEAGERLGLLLLLSASRNKQAAGFELRGLGSMGPRATKHAPLKG